MNDWEEQGSDAWKAMRKNKIGASEAPIIMGISPYCTAYELWQRKLGLLPEQEETPAMTRGKELEPVARKYCEELFGMKFNPEVRFHPEIPYMLASLDGISLDGTMALEIKCNGKKTHDTFINTKEVPLHHYAQMQHQMFVLGMNSMNYISFDGQDGVVHTFYRDERFIKDMLEKIDAFWKCLENLNPPTMTEKDMNRIQKNETLIKEDEEWNLEVSKYLKQKSDMEFHKDMMETHKERLIGMSNGMNCQGSGIKLTKIMKAGSLNYSKIIESELKGVDLEKYRNPSTEYWKVENE